MNKLIVARINKKVKTFSAKFESKKEVNKITANIKFKIDEPIEGIQGFYSDIGMISRHYLVTSKTHHKLNRMYTICNCLRPDAYKYYIALMKAKMEGKDL